MIEKDIFADQCNKFEDFERWKNTYSKRYVY